jgi:thiamine biosynthesis protein ThiS
MKLKVNYVISNEYKEGLTIQGLLDYKNIEAVPWLVVSVNGTFIKRDKFKEHVLNDEDVIEMIYVRGGG